MTALPSYEEALGVALSVVQPVCNTEIVSISGAGAVGRILAQDIVADRDQPPFDRSTMDGFAVKASEVSKGASMYVIGEVASGTSFEGSLQENSCVSIATGAPVPEGFDAVVPHEQTDNGTDVVCFDVDEVAEGASIHSRGADAKAGDVLIAKHTMLSPQHVGIIASVSSDEVPVISKPRVVVITSGDEVVEQGVTPQHHQIRNGNNPMICAMFTAMGCEVIGSNHVSDDPDETNACISEAVGGSADLVVTIGGISAGKRDFFPAAFANSGVDLVVKGASVQPGRPVIVGSCDQAVVLGLPGNPVSALVCSTIFGWPIVKQMQGINLELPWQHATLGAAVKPNPKRLAFRPCLLVDGEVTVPSWQGSGDLVHTGVTQGLVQLPSSDSELQKGMNVQCLAYPWCYGN
jgi:molybdopterin molybdotransferase